MISAGMDDEVRPTLGSVPNMAVYGSVWGALYPSMIRGILHLLNKLNANNPIL